MIPPIGPTEPFEKDLAGRGDLVPVDDVAPELLDHLEREREPRRRPADVAGVDRHVDREVDVSAGTGEDRSDDRRCEPGPAAAV